MGTDQGYCGYRSGSGYRSGTGYRLGFYTCNTQHPLNLKWTRQGTRVNKRLFGLRFSENVQLLTL